MRLLHGGDPVRHVRLLDPCDPAAVGRLPGVHPADHARGSWAGSAAVAGRAGDLGDGVDAETEACGCADGLDVRLWSRARPARRDRLPLLRRDVGRRAPAGLHLPAYPSATPVKRSGCSAVEARDDRRDAGTAAGRQDDLAAPDDRPRRGRAVRRGAAREQLRPLPPLHGSPAAAQVLTKLLGAADGIHDALLGAFGIDGRLVGVAQFDRSRRQADRRARDRGGDRLAAMRSRAR